MSAIKTVALAGASGSIGSAIVHALLDSGFAVTALTRSDSPSTFPPGVQVASVDYTSLSSLTSALQGHDALISAVGYAGMAGQGLLIDAAIAAGVQRIIPSEYGSDPAHARVRALPVFADKVQTEQAIKSKTRGTATTYTLICNNEFFDWDLAHGFGADVGARKIEILDGGAHGFSAAPLAFVARGVVAVLERPAETADRVVRLHGATMTQEKLLAMLRRCADGWEVTHVSAAEREEQAYEMLRRDPGNVWGWAVAFLQCAVFGREFGNDFSGNNDNELLGLKELSDAELEEIVRSHVQGS